MRIKTWLAQLGAGLFSAWLLAAPAAMAEGAEPPPFQVTLPDGVSTRVQRGPDFTVFYFDQGDVTFAGAYLGNYPMFSPDPNGGAIQQKVECKGAVVVKREILLPLKYERSTSYIHAWTVAGADPATAEAILRSIRWPGKNDGVGSTPLMACP
jgi:hypothetical protein